MGTEGIPAVMNVTPTGGNGNDGAWGGSWASWIILFLIFGMFGWGGFGGFGGGFGGMGGVGAYPVEAITQRQLDTQSIIGKLDGINGGICSGFYDTQNAINGLGMNVMQGFNQANITALQNANALQAQLADCCCGTQRAIDAVRYDMAKGDCATLTAINTATRDIVDNANQNTRAVLDYLYQDKLSSLQAENQALRLSASQAAQNNAIGARIDAATAEILRRTGSDCPVPAYVVQPPQPVGFAVNCNGQAVMGRPGCGPCAG